jgi:hypothetical protein
MIQFLASGGITQNLGLIAVRSEIFLTLANSTVAFTLLLLPHKRLTKKIEMEFHQIIDGCRAFYLAIGGEKFAPDGEVLVGGIFYNLSTPRLRLL